MPIFALNESLLFPPPHLAEPDGILAIGGDLTPQRLLLAYEKGIFPWYSETEPILWWSPDPRFVLYPDALKIAKSMRPILRKGIFQVSYDQEFKQVVGRCKQIARPGQEGTWITGDMMNAYCTLHDMGFAHSVEVWKDDQLVGGLYGVSLGRCFFGESMFAEVSNASKVGFITMVQDLRERQFQLIDCQVPTQHLASFGAIEIARQQFLTELEEGLIPSGMIGNWGQLMGRTIPTQ
ncbi:MAG: leucyl/phenylalanyl-tRNA--protein transferase [Bacteroidota bacterium]